MRLVITTEERLQRTPDGRVWSTGTFAHRFWQPYLSVFDEVGVAARVLPVSEVPAGMACVDGDRVAVCAMPHYVGPGQFLRQRAAIHRALGEMASPRDAVLVRAPSAVGALLCSVLARRGQPYGVEVIGDPRDAFGAGSIQHPLRPLFQRWFIAQLRRQCRRAAGAAYVTGGSLKVRYPTRPGAFTAVYSDIELGAEAFVAGPRTGVRGVGVLRLVTVGSLEQLYKGTDTLIEAVASLRRSGVAVRLLVVGDGRYRPMLEELAARLGVSDAVEFAGAVPPGAPVRRHLDDADLFVLPSRAEGLPKAVIEAMARALPCVASAVGGNPELLPPEDLVAPGDATALAGRLREVLLDEGRLRAMSARNLAHARDYSADRLLARRETFYRALRAATATYAGASAGAEGAGTPAATGPMAG